MYDLQGSDTDREWIEISNTGGDAIDLSSWKFFEANTNHSLTLIQGPASISSGGYAIVVDNPEKFLLDYPGFPLTIFDSSFSLSNTGELLSLKSAEGTEIDTVSYISEWGGVGDGSSLQKIGSSFKSGVPTPGAANKESSPPQETSVPSSQTTQNNESPSQQNAGVDEEIERLYPDAGEDRSVIVGAEVEFVGSSLGIKKEPLKNGRFLWNFGDGKTGEGKKVLHTYKHPGIYKVILDVSSGEFSGSDHIIVTAVSGNIVIGKTSPGLDGYITLLNKSEFEIDLSRWIIRADGKEFTIPNNTHILSQQDLAISNEVTGFSDYTEIPTLHYPNGSRAFYPQDEIIKTAPLAVSTPGDEEKTEAPRATSNTLKPKTEILKKEPEEVQETIGERGEKESAAAAAINSGEDGHFLKWILLLGVLIVSGVAALFFIRQKPKIEEDLSRRDRSEADKYEIIGSDET